MEDIQEKYNHLLQQNEALRQENEELKLLLHAHGIEYKPKHAEEKDDVYSPFTFPSVKLSIEERVAIFHSLFKGREDVFARRWFSKTTGKSGYQPVCINEWRRGVCDKKKYKCADCPNRHFAPLTYQDLYRHLEGKDENCCDVVGLYAIMPDNNCTFLCTDFDDKSCKHGYKDDVLAFVGVCKEWNIPYAIERSRSGNGAHVWIFFEEPIPAFKARRLGNAILTEAMRHNGRMSFNSYDRFFPNQDRMPEGGFGNLVALPLQGQARKRRNSVLVNQLSELAHFGIEILIITTASNPETEYLLQRGLSVRILPEVKLCTTIIDKGIVWYGAINALGYATEEDNVIKVINNKLANELLEVLLTS